MLVGVSHILEVNQGPHLLASVRSGLNVGRHQRGRVVELHIESSRLSIGLQRDQRVGIVGAVHIIVIIT